MSSSRNAPLTARSVLASVLLGTDPPWLPTALLVRTAALFGIAEGSARTALSRLVAAGEAVPERGGYRLAGSLLDRRARQAASRQAKTRHWDGTWELAVVGSEAPRAAVDRAALRQTLTRLRRAELREGVWGRPDNLDPVEPAVLEELDRWCGWWWGARPRPAPDPSALWGLDAWAADAAELREHMHSLLAPLESGDLSALAPGFVTSAAVLRLLQADPMLPPELVGRDWPGADLRADYDHYDALYRELLRAWFGDAP